MDDVPGLVEQLGDPDPERRRDAADTLAQRGASAVGALLKALSDENDIRRAGAAEALAQICDGRVGDSFHALLGAVLQPAHDDDTRQGAVEKLRQLWARRAVDALIERLSAEDESVRRRASWALWRLGEHGELAMPEEARDVRYWSEWGRGELGIGNRDTEDGLVRGLGDPSAEVRGHCARVLADLGVTRAVDSLVELLADADPGVRRHAADALGRLGNARQRGAGPLCRLLDDPCADVRAASAMALGRLGDTRSLVVEPVRRRLRDSCADVRAASAKALGKLKDAGGASALVPLLDDPEPSVQRSAAWALSQIGDIRGMIDLCGLLGHEARGVRCYAAEALGEIGDVRAVDRLLPLLKDADAGVRGAVASALGALGAPWVAGQLLPLLTDRSAEVRCGAADSLGRLRSTHAEVVETLRSVLGDDCAEVRAAAAEALGRLGTASDVDHLRPLLRDPEPEVRRRAAWALGRLGDRGAAEGLSSLLKDGCPEVRRRAAWALGMLGDPIAFEALVEALRSDSVDYVRRRAGWALGMLGDQDAAQPVRERLLERSCSPRTQLFARAALCQLATSDAERRQHAEKLTDALTSRYPEGLAELALHLLRDVGARAENVVAEALAETPTSTETGGMPALMLALALSVSERYRPCATRVILDLLHDHRAPIEAAIDDAYRDRLFGRLASLATLRDQMQSAVAPGGDEAERWDLSAVVDQVIGDGYLQGIEPALTLTALRLVGLAGQLGRIPTGCLTKLVTLDDPEVQRLAAQGLGLQGPSATGTREALEVCRAHAEGRGDAESAEWAEWALRRVAAAAP